MSETDYLQRAIDHVGGQTTLADEINLHLSSRVPKIKQANVWSWLHRSGRVPPEYAISLQIAVGGVVTAAEVCPDVFRPDIAELTLKVGVAA